MYRPVKAEEADISLLKCVTRLVCAHVDVVGELAQGYCLVVSLSKDPSLTL